VIGVQLKPGGTNKNHEQRILSSQKETGETKLREGGAKRQVFLPITRATVKNRHRKRNIAYPRFRDQGSGTSTCLATAKGVPGSVLEKEVSANKKSTPPRMEKI